MKQADSESFEEVVINLFLVVLGIIVLVPVVLIYSVTREPSAYQDHSYARTYKPFLAGVCVSILLIGAGYFMDAISGSEIFKIGNKGIKAMLIIEWISLNLLLGSIAYLLIPLWVRVANKNNNIKDSLY